MSRPALWLVNASPFIGLAKAGHLPLLTAPGREWFLPEVVAREIAAGPAGDAAVQALRQLASLGKKPLPATAPDARLAPLRLDAGEEAVLTEALARPGSAVVIDDGRGRRAAQALGVPCTGTLGVLILARQEGRLKEMAPALRALRDAGIFLPPDAFLRRILSQIGEAWP